MKGGEWVGVNKFKTIYYFYRRVKYINLKKNPYNCGKNSKGQKKRGKPKSGETGTVYTEDGHKKAQSLYQQKNTILKKVNVYK